MRQKLQRHILERRCRAVPQLQHAGILIHLHQRHRIITKFVLRIGSIHAFAQLVLAEVSQILQKHINRALRIRLMLHGLNIHHAHCRNILRHKQAAVSCQTTRNCMS